MYIAAMELRHIRYFLAVAEELHFGRAAKRLAIAQPPLSKQIKQLEDELDVELFRRNSRKVELTEAGFAFFRQAKAMVELSRSMVDTVQAIAKGETGTLTVGFNEPAIDSILPATIKAMRLEHPGINLSLREMQTAEQLEALRRYRIDVGIVRLFSHDLAGLHSRLLLREQYVVAMPRRHRLAAEKEIKLSVLNDESLIVFPAKMQPLLHAHLMRCFEKAGGRPRIVQEAVTKHTTLSLIAAGLGIAIVPKSTMKFAPKSLTNRPVRSGLPDIEYFLVWRDEPPSGVLKVFLSVLTASTNRLPC